MPDDPESVRRTGRYDAFDGPTDLRLAHVAAEQHGCVATWQLRDPAVSPTELRRRVASGHLHRRFRGVYAVGHPGLSPDGTRMAAVLTVGLDLCSRIARSHTTSVSLTATVHAGSTSRWPGEAVPASPE